MNKEETRKFKQVNIATNNWDKYNQTALKLSVERGIRISIPALLDEAFIHYYQKYK